MKKILLTLLLCPVIAQAQFLECSVGGGPTIHNMQIGYFWPGIPRTGYNINVSATTQVVKGIRLGLSGTYAYMPFNEGFGGGYTQYSYKYFFDPVFLEFIAVSRSKLRRFDLDLGVIGGICLNKRIVTKTFPGEHLSNDYYPKMWYTYGLTVSVQYNISKRFALGVNVHPALLDMAGLRENFFTMPLSVRGTIKI